MGISWFLMVLTMWLKKGATFSVLSLKRHLVTDFIMLYCRLAPASYEDFPSLKFDASI
uniref:Uncharacterized protein n=1 Tax=Arundo donax TaxID=35708 RepID=A0A0A9FBC1_ARUDO